MSAFEPYSYRADPAVPDFLDDKPLIVLDGHCVMCSRSAAFVLAHDPAGNFRMTAAQTALGDALFRHYGMKSTDYQTVLLIEAGRVRLRSDAALRILEVLGIWRPVLRLARIVPKPLADAVYRLIARNRVGIWGARDTYYAPPPEMRDRFL